MPGLIAMGIALRLNISMPSIGFCSKNRRINAFLITAHKAEELAAGDAELAIEALSELTRISRPFYKASAMAVMNLNSLGRHDFPQSAWTFANALAIKEGYPAHPHYSC